MQKIATRIFIYSSIAFGIVGLLMVLLGVIPDGNKTGASSEILGKLLFTTVFIILPSFALSVAGKYLNDK